MEREVLMPGRFENDRSACASGFLLLAAACGGSESNATTTTIETPNKVDSARKERRGGDLKVSLTIP